MPHVLLVEDQVLNADMLKRRLERRGFSVVVATDGVESLEMAEAETPDLILMDISLPRMDGWEATRELRRRPATRTIPIIALTAHTADSDREQSLSAGCDDYATKPIDFERLLEKMSQLLARGKSR